MDVKAESSQSNPTTGQGSTAQPVTPQCSSARYNSLAELRDLILHMERVSVGLKGGLYSPTDEDFDDLATQLFSLASQLKEFSRQKASLILPGNMY